MSEERLGAPNEKMRLCPSCRMSIPVLAVKCRFCGEEVGRPRDETRKLSISDLGGQDATMYAPSSSVMEALESFRTEEFTSAPPPEPQKRSIFGKKKPQTNTPPPAHSADMPQLDENSQALASLSMPTRPRARTYTPPEPTWMKKIGYLGAFIAAILILYFGGIQVVAVINDWRKPPPAAIKPNRAPELIEEAKAGDVTKFGDALAEAVKLQSEQPTPDNERILDQSREFLLAKVRELLDAQDWKPQMLEDASLNMSKVMGDSDKRVRELDAERLLELRDYKSTELVGFGKDSAGKDTATFSIKVNGKSGEPMSVGVGDKLNNRFEITSIDAKSGTVRMIDTKRHDRKVSCVLKNKCIYLSPQTGR